MWTAAAGASTQSQNLDIIANNLANADTAAFKKDVPTFKEYLATVEREHATADIPRGPIKDKDLYPLDGRDQSYVVMDGTHTSFRQGALKVTQAPLDIAMDGPGFIEIDTPAGVRYTRQGSLKIAPDGKLVTSEGYPVLAATPSGLTVQNVNGNSNSVGSSLAGLNANNAARYINLRDRGNSFSISDAGEIYAGDDLIAKLSIAEFQDLKKLKKSGGQIFSNLDPINKISPQHTQVRQGVIETSNVNPIEEMTNMIKANRLFEQDLKSLKTYGEMMSKESNDIGKL